MLAIMAGILAVLIALITLLDPPEEPDPSGAIDRQEIPATESTRVELVTADSTITAERSDGQWWIVDPLHARADDRAIEDLIGAFDRLESSEAFEGADPADFGLDAPAARLSVVDAGGITHTLTVGARAPVGFKTYVDIGDGQVRAAEGDLIASVALGLDDLRDRRVYRFAASAVTGVRWEAEGESWAATRTEDGWRLSDGRRASASRLEGLLAGLGALELDRFVPDSALGQPSGTLVIELDGEPPARIVAGREDAEGVVIQTPSGTAGTIASLDLLRPYVSELLEARLLPVELGAVAALDIELDGRSARYVSDGAGGWTRDGAEVEAGPINQLLTVGTADRAAVGEPGRPHGALTVELEGGAMTVHLGEETAGGRQAWEDAGPAFVVPSQTVDLIESLL